MGQSWCWWRSWPCASTPSLTGTSTPLFSWHIRVLERLAHGVRIHCISWRAVGKPLLRRERKLRLRGRLVDAELLLLLLLLLTLCGWALSCGPAIENPV